jgi:AGZA family xanthine/uracil permease-like MFS transporter
MVIGSTVLVSARWNPFYGLVAGLAIKVVFGL